MELRDCFKIGYIQKPHGLKGEVTMAVDADDPFDVDGIKTFFLQDGSDLVPYFIQSISLRGAKAFVKFEDVDTPEAATLISKRSVFLPKTERPKSGRGEFYDDEIAGFMVIDEALGELGLIVEVVSAGPNKLLAVDHKGREILIPVAGPFIKSVNKSKKRVMVLLPDGFLDI